MKNLLRIATAVIMSTAFVGTAQASLHVEPFLGFAVAGEVDDGTPPTVDVSGTEMGVRLGYSMLGFAAGLEYASGGFETDETPAADIDSTDIGLFVGFTFPVMIQVYAAYHLSSEADVTGGTISGSGTRIGVGFTGLPFVAINVEQTMHSYDEFEGSGSTITLSPEIEVSRTMLSVSLPLSL